MNTLKEEFGFIPSELLYKCDQFVKAFHQRRGSGMDFVAASHVFSVKSPYLGTLEKNIVLIGNLPKLAIAPAVVVIVAAMFTGWWWVLALLVPIAFVAIYCYKLGEKTTVQQRAIILAVEALAIDFAGWGQLFPRACQIANVMFSRDAGDWPKLIDLYLPPERRADADFVTVFAPSERSVALAQSTECPIPSFLG
jgi:hypothetical protein